MVKLDFDIVSVKQMTTTRQSPSNNQTRSVVPYNAAQGGKVAGNLQSAKTSPYFHQDGGV
jgi:hypothetical protein